MPLSSEKWPHRQSDFLYFHCGTFVLLPPEGRHPDDTGPQEEEEERLTSKHVPLKGYSSVSRCILSHKTPIETNKVSGIVSRTKDLLLHNVRIELLGLVDGGEESNHSWVWGRGPLDAALVLWWPRFRFAGQRWRKGR